MGEAAVASPHRSPVDQAAERLALDKNYVVGLSVAAFLSGAAGAVVFSFRKRPPPDVKKQALFPPKAAAPVRVPHALQGAEARVGQGYKDEEARSRIASAAVKKVLHKAEHGDAPSSATAPFGAPAATAAGSARSATAVSSATLPESEPAPLFEAAKKGPFAIFREMNASIFSAFRSEQPKTRPMRVAALQAAPSSGASPSGTPPSGTPLSSTPPPGVRIAPAMRAAAPTGGLSALHKNPQVVAAAAPQPTPEESARSDGPLLAFGAFSLATTIVCGVSLAVVFAVRQTLNITSVEEFADYMHERMPRLGRDGALAPYLPAVPVEHDANDVTIAPPGDDVGERMERTEDPVEWVRLARLQLDTELAEHQAQREARRRRRESATLE